MPFDQVAVGRWNKAVELRSDRSHEGPPLSVEAALAGRTIAPKGQRRRVTTTKGADSSAENLGMKFHLPIVLAAAVLVLRCGASEDDNNTPSSSEAPSGQPNDGEAHPAPNPGAPSTEAPGRDTADAINKPADWPAGAPDYYVFEPGPDCPNTDPKLKPTFLARCNANAPADQRVIAAVKEAKGAATCEALADSLASFRYSDTLVLQLHKSADDTALVSLAFLQEIDGLCRLHLNRDYGVKAKLALNDLAPVTSLKALAVQTSDPEGDDLSALKDVTSLESLWIGRITSTAFLSSLTNLRTFVITGGAGTQDRAATLDFGPLAALQNLRYLNIGFQHPASFEFLRSLPKLDHLELFEAGAAPLAVISGMTMLRELRYYQSPLDAPVDLEPLRGLQNLVKIEVPYAQSLEPLRGKPYLHTVNYGNRPSGEATLALDLSPLGSLPWLRFLRVEDASIAGFDPLQGATRLMELHLSNVQSKTLAGLAPLPKLRSLHVGGSIAGILNGLSTLTQLTDLELNYTGLVDTSVLAPLTALETLDLKFNQITDTTPLASLTRLKRLDLNGNPLADKDHACPPVTGLKCGI